MCSYNCVQLKLFAKTFVEHAGGNEAAHSAQGDTSANGITQPGRLRGQGIPNRFRHQSRIVSAFDVDRKSTRLNSSHLGISYAVFCLKKKKKRLDTSAHERSAPRKQNGSTEYSQCWRQRTYRR